MDCSSASTNRGTMISDSSASVSTMSAIRPSMMAEVSSRSGRGPLFSRANSTYGMTNRNTSFVCSTNVTQMYTAPAPSSSLANCTIRRWVVYVCHWASRAL